MRRVTFNFRGVLRASWPWLVAIAVAGGGFGAFKYGHAADYTAPLMVRVEAKAMEVSVALGLRLNNLTVEGRNMTSRADLLAAIDAERGAPILAIDVAKTREAVEALPWVKTAKVERRLPDAVHVMIEERVPYALWQQGNRYTLVDREGKLIVDVPEADGSLPLIVGADAPARAAELFDMIAAEPSLASRVRAAVRVGDRRWNLYLDTFENGIAIHLPEDDMNAAWSRLAGLERDYKILERDLDFIDLRLTDRLIVRLHGGEPVDAARKRTHQEGVDADGTETRRMSRTKA